jgi:DNA-binding NtrC family response regulator
MGRVEEADGGTIFLDEIADMSRPLQAKLLRFLEDGTFTRVGGNEELKVNVRLISATNRDVIQSIQESQFREDLYHRLNVVQMRPPPLRERGEDIARLARHFLRQFSRVMNKRIEALSPAAEQQLLSHHWPGNVRELRNVIERAVILETGRDVQPASLPDFKWETGLRKAAPLQAPVDQSLDDCLAEFEKQLITATLERNQFNVGRTAEQLKMSRHALRYRMQRLNIQSENGLEEEESAAGKDSR